MKEIKTLMQQLRSYPSNFFVYPKDTRDMLEDEVLSGTIGLSVCNHLGEEQGFIETGGEEGIVIQ